MDHRNGDGSYGLILILVLSIVGYQNWDKISRNLHLWWERVAWPFLVKVIYFGLVSAVCIALFWLLCQLVMQIYRDARKWYQELNSWRENVDKNLERALLLAESSRDDIRHLFDALKDIRDEIQKLKAAPEIKKEVEEDPKAALIQAAIDGS